MRKATRGARKGEDMEDAGFRTLTGYRQQDGHGMTEAMEDYLEMIYRAAHRGEGIRISDLAERLHVRPSSASRMVTKLADNGFLRYEKYGVIRLTEDGYTRGAYLLWRHGVLNRFFCHINRTNSELTLVEQIEHFIDERTVQHLAQLLSQMELQQKATE